MKHLLSDGRRRYFSPQEVADYFGISRRTLYDIIDRGELRAGKIGRSVRISRDEVTRYEREQMGVPA
jgi:putative molybdopterin biosynthesis protein